MGLARREVLGGAALLAAGVGGLPKLFAAPAETGSGGSLVASVLDFGAKGDGRADDADAIAAAIASVASRAVTDEPGGVVYLPAGSYLSSKQVVIPKNILLVGESPYATRLRYIGSPISSFIEIGEPAVIAEFSGVQSMWVDCDGKAKVAINFWGPQEGSRVSETMAVGATEVVLDVHAEGIEGGSNKFVVEKCWFWTSGDDGLAGIRLGAQSGPLSIRDTTVVGTNRTKDAPAGSAGVIVEDSKVTIDNVNVEHFDCYALITRTMADIRSPTSFHTNNGVRTTADSTGYPLLISNALFDNVTTAVDDRGAGVALAYCRSYTSESHGSLPQGFQSARWNVGSANVYRSATAQTRMGYDSDATADTSRFKFTAMTGGGWRESAAIDGDGVFGSAASSFDGAHLRLGGYHLWVDSAGRLRMKQGAPSADDDGSVVGQS